MMMKKFVLLFVAMISIISCSNEERNRLPRIDPGHIELSTENTEGYFQVSPRDYDMCCFVFNDQEYRITNAIKKEKVTVIDISGGYKATLYSKNSMLHKIDIGFMTVEKRGKGKYYIQLTKNIDIKKQNRISFGFLSSDGISSAVITFKE